MNHFESSVINLIWTKKLVLLYDVYSNNHAVHLSVKRCLTEPTFDRSKAKLWHLTEGVMLDYSMNELWHLTEVTDVLYNETKGTLV